jgi:integrase
LPGGIEPTVVSIDELGKPCRGSFCQPPPLRRDQVVRDPCAKVRPVFRRQIQREDRTRPFSEAQLRHFLTTADRVELRVAPYFWTMALQGPRPGEALALQARDVDFAGLALTIERAVDKRGQMGAPKDGERRTIDLHSRLVPVLKRAVRERKEETLKRGRPWDDTANLFATRTGKPFDLANAARGFKRVLRAMTPEGQEPPRHSLYDLRHTFATLLLAGSGGSPPAPITYVAAQMGHATPATTLRFYARWIPRQGRRYIDGLLAVRPEGDDAAADRGQSS